MNISELFNYVKNENTNCDLYKDLLLIKDIDLYKNLSIQNIDFENIIEKYKKSCTPLITCAILTYNEEDNIYKCISSIYNEFDEILILDSFSTDNTINIIQTHFPKATIKYKTWENDFSSSRNHLIELCKNNWIYFLDADNYYDDENNKFRRSIKLLNFLNFEDVASPLISEFNGHIYTDNRKLFNKKNNIKFYGKVHEEPLKNNEEPKNITLDILIKHTGYDAQKVDIKQKTIRNLKLSKEMMLLEPNNPKWIYFYCRELYFLENNHINNIIDLLKKAIYLYENKSYKRYFIETLILLCDISLKNNRIKEFKNSLFYLNKYFPECIDTDYYNALIIYLDINRRLTVLSNELNNLDKRKPSFINSNNEHIEALNLDLAWSLKDMDLFKDAYNKISNENSKNLIKNRLLYYKSILHNIE